MKTEKRAAKIAEAQRQHDEILASRCPVFTSTIFGVEVVNLGGLAAYYSELEAASESLAYHTLLYFLENGEWYGQSAH